ncbi:hypothetical protein VNI00_014983 [Paramarasmius palmivorus]|uniref:F-box domain-containing protein n=1 Tax=Paramarasmius palmivorus TaxID=297713 RepID=A0AAW0BNF6_9AGAR
MLRRHIQERKSQNSAVYRIPSELWSEVFTLACQSEQSALDVFSAEMRALPFALSHVSAYWRGIILGLPKLWSSVIVDLCRISKGRERIVELYLQNSGSQPLDLGIHQARAFNSGIGTLKEHLGQHGYSSLKTLMSEFSRCKTLTIDFEGEALASIPRPWRRGLSFPILESFSYVCMDLDNEVDEGNSWLWHQIHNAPLLRELTVPNDSSFLSGTHPANITTLSIADTSVDSLLHILSICPHIAELSWFGFLNIIPPIGVVPRTQQIRIPNLRKISLSHLPAQELDSFIASVTLPGLVAVSIGPLDHQNGYWAGEATFSAMLERSRPVKVKELKLDFRDSYLSLDGLCGILSRCKGLQSLEVVVKGDFSGFVREFVYQFATDTTPTLVPDLTHLRLHEVLPRTRRLQILSPETQERILHLAESRSCSSDKHGLRQLHISFSAGCYPSHNAKHRELDLEPDIAARNRVLRSRGVKFLLEWIDPEPKPGAGSEEVDEQENTSDSDSNAGE